MDIISSIMSTFLVPICRFDAYTLCIKSNKKETPAAVSRKIPTYHGATLFNDYVEFLDLSLQPKTMFMRNIPHSVRN